MASEHGRSRIEGLSMKATRSKPHIQTFMEPIVAFYIFAAVNLLAALFTPITDCDEVFNYWEPTHYLNHGYGLQTWEYSPEFSIRSWLYIVLHAAVGKLGHVFLSNKSHEFYFIRLILGLVCAMCQTRLFSTISKVMNPRVGIMFMIVTLSSPGMFSASVAYLPSSFAMYTTMLGTTAFMDWRGGSKTNAGIMWFGIGGIMGWPFAIALIGPLIFEELVLASFARKGFEVFWRLLDGTVRCLIVLALQVAFDAFFYHKVTVVPWNIISYNVLSGAGRGPEIFGTEPWDFYIRNLLLNFHIWFVLALLVGPIVLLQPTLTTRSLSGFTTMRALFFITPFYMWLVIFSMQPHKEERFMYPAYPFLVLNATIVLHTFISYVGSLELSKYMSKIPAKVKVALVTMFLISAIDVGAFRIIGLITAYRAPLLVYSALQQPGLANPGDTVCLGKEWYRFPSSYHLPNGMKAKFIKSAFDGLLPGEFNEAQVGFGLFAGTWLIPPGMNDQNIADSTKHIDIAHCSFLVDSHFEGTSTSSLEPDYMLDSSTWEEMQCHRFLDAAKTSMLGRVFWFPELSWVPYKHRRRWGKYCLLRRQKAT